MKEYLFGIRILGTQYPFLNTYTEKRSQSKSPCLFQKMSLVNKQIRVTRYKNKRHNVPW